MATREFRKENGQVFVVYGTSKAEVRGIEGVAEREGTPAEIRIINTAVMAGLQGDRLNEGESVSGRKDWELWFPVDIYSQEYVLWGVIDKHPKLLKRGEPWQEGVPESWHKNSCYKAPKNPGNIFGQ